MSAVLAQTLACLPQVQWVRASISGELENFIMKILILGVGEERAGSSSGKVNVYGLDVPGSIPGAGGVEIFSSLLRVQTGRGVHSAFYKLITRVLDLPLPLTSAVAV